MYDKFIENLARKAYDVYRKGLNMSLEYDNLPDAIKSVWIHIACSTFIEGMKYRVNPISGNIEKRTT